MVGAEEILGRGLLHPVSQVHFLIGIRRQRIGKEADPDQEQDDHPAEHPEGFLLEQPDEEICKPTPSLGFTFFGGYSWCVFHIAEFFSLSSGFTGLN